MKNISRMTAVIFGSLATAGFGVDTCVAADPSAEGSSEAQASCDALAGASGDSVVAINKIHDIGPTISPALPHPDNPEMETGQVNMIQLFFQARDIAGSLHRAGGGLRGAQEHVDLDDMRSAAEDLAQAQEDTAVAFDSASNILGPRPPMDELAGSMFEHISTTMNAFHHFNDVYSEHCGVDLRPDWDNPTQAADPVDEAADEAGEQAAPEEEQDQRADEAAEAADDQAPPAEEEQPEDSQLEDNQGAPAGDDQAQAF